MGRRPTCAHARISSTRGSLARSAVADGRCWHCASDLRKRVGGRWSPTVSDDSPATFLPRTEPRSPSALGGRIRTMASQS